MEITMPPGTPISNASPLQRISLAILGLTMAALGVFILQGFVRSLVWAAIFAVALKPLYTHAERRWPQLHRTIVLPGLFPLAVLLVFVVPLVLLLFQLSHEVSALSHLAVDYQKTGVPMPDFLGNLPGIGQSAQDWWQQNLSDPQDMQALLGHLNRDELLSFSRTFGSNVLHRVVLFIFTILTLFFLFRDGDALIDQMYRAANRTFGHRGGAVGAQIVASVHGTVNGLVLVGIGEGALIGIAYWIAGVPHATVFGAVTAVAAMLPFGAPLVFGAAALILLAQGKMIAAIAVFTFGFVVAFVADHAIRPALIGGATRLPFIWVLLGILGGVETFGLLGLFVGPAVMSALILLWREWAQEPSEPATISVEPRRVVECPPGTAA
jgi:predicted PurR-regulated permease PerM